MADGGEDAEGDELTLHHFLHRKSCDISESFPDIESVCVNLSWECWVGDAYIFCGLGHDYGI